MAYSKDYPEQLKKCGCRECKECKYVEVCRPTFQACPEHEVKTTITTATSLGDTLKKQEEKSECICSDDRAGGSFTNGHFDNCPCHKSECCEKCKNFKVSIRFGVNRCLNSNCPCHLGDTLKKQEEKECEVCHARAKNSCCGINYCDEHFNGDPVFNTKLSVSRMNTPHESEDWSEFNPLLFQDFNKEDGRYYTNIEKLKNFIRQEKSKTLKEVLDYLQKNHLDYCQEQNGLNYCKNCGLDLEDIIKHFKIK